LTSLSRRSLLAGFHFDFETLVAKTPVDPETAHAQAIADAKRLMRISRTGALATLDPASGAPLATLVGVASDFDGAPLFLMSTLARHTKHLAHDPRASILLVDEPERGDPLNHPRLTLTGRIERAVEPQARTRYLQRNPKAKLYADFADFSFFRLAIEGVHFNGGFGRADALAPADILIRREAEAAFTEAEPCLVDWVNGLGDEVLGRLAGRARAGRQIWRAIGLDAEGLDLSAGGESARLQFESAAEDVAGWRRRLEAAVAGSSRSKRDGPR
jgi:heme iron utilization protein